MAIPLPRIQCCWLIALILCGALASAAVARDGAETSPTQGDQPAQDTTTRPEHRDLKAGSVSATVTVLGTDRPFPADASVFARIRLENTSKAKFAEAELVLESQVAIISDISGGAAAVSDAGGTRIAKVEKIAQRKPRTVIVELKARQDLQPGGAGASRNTLNVTLRQPGATGQTATLEWNVANCAGGFYAEIVKVREGSGAEIADALKAARSRDKSRPGRWLFPPRYKVARSNRKCTKRVKRWNKRRGKFYYPCVQHEELEPVARDAGPAPYKAEREVFRFAARYVSARALDRELSQKRDSGWAAQRVSQNLQYFLDQDANPAICTGTMAFFDYFDKRMAGFAKRAEMFAEMNVKAQELARLRFTEAVSAAPAQPEGHPGWGAAPLDLPQGESSTPLKKMLATLARLTGNAALADGAGEAQSPIEALRAMSGFLKSGDAKSLEAPLRRALYRALSAIEAADYIGTVAGHYGGLRHALLGSMSTIRKAHASNCTCGS